MHAAHDASEARARRSRAESSYEETARRQRGLAQRMYLLDEIVEGSSDGDSDGATCRVVYAVQGTTHRVYDVVVSRRGAAWSCTCPDYLRRRRDCKHVYFVRDRALAPRVARIMEAAPETRPTLAVWQAAQSSMFAANFGQPLQPPGSLASSLSAGPSTDGTSNGPAEPTRATPSAPAVVQTTGADTAAGDDLVHDLLGTASARRQYLDAKRQRAGEPNAETSQDRGGTPHKEPMRRPIDGQSCGICLDDLDTTERLLYCETSCGNAVHADCYDRWAASALARHTGRAPWEATCVYCRQPMSAAATKQSGASKKATASAAQIDCITIEKDSDSSSGSSYSSSSSSSSSSSDSSDSDSDSSSSDSDSDHHVANGGQTALPRGQRRAMRQARIVAYYATARQGKRRRLDQ